MLYREAGDFKTSYARDQALIPIRQDRVMLYIVIAIALVTPVVASHSISVKNVWVAGTSVNEGVAGGENVGAPAKR